MDDEAGAPGRLDAGRRRRQVGLVTVIVASLALLALTYAIVAGAGVWPGNISVHAFEELIRSWGMWGVAASIGLMVIHTFVPFPAEFVAIANGKIYGLLWGVVVTWTGAMLGAYVAFTLARAFGRPFVDRMVARRHWRRADEMLTRHGTAAVFVGRFFPVISFNLINWAAGLTGMSLWTFTWATGLGILPVTVLMVFLGDRMETIPWWGWILLLLGAFAMIPLGRWLYRLHIR
jgi:uncharacterized membrane protein YdjX (TVP38/TMEM64 family)